MTNNDVTLRECVIEQWKFYGYDISEVMELLSEERITNKSVFSNFFHWYVDDKLMFAEWQEPDGTWSCIPYRMKEEK